MGRGLSCAPRTFPSPPMMAARGSGCLVDDRVQMVWDDFIDALNPAGIGGGSTAVQDGSSMDLDGPRERDRRRSPPPAALSGPMRTDGRYPEGCWFESNRGSHPRARPSGTCSLRITTL